MSLQNRHETMTHLMTGTLALCSKTFDLLVKQGLGVLGGQYGSHAKIHPDLFYVTSCNITFSSHSQNIMRICVKVDTCDWTGTF
jgi:hypothetical protein